MVTRLIRTSFGRFKRLWDDSEIEIGTDQGGFF